MTHLYDQMLSNYEAWRATQYLVTPKKDEWIAISSEAVAKRNGAWMRYVEARNAWEGTI